MSAITGELWEPHVAAWVASLPRRVREHPRFDEALALFYGYITPRTGAEVAGLLHLWDDSDRPSRYDARQVGDAEEVRRMDGVRTRDAVKVLANVMDAPKMEADVGQTVVVTIEARVSSRYEQGGQLVSVLQPTAFVEGRTGWA
jgi:hypothetical protein